MSQKIKYLYDSAQITNVLAQGFAKVCQQKPRFPINYLARYLKNHTTKKNQKSDLIDKMQKNQKILGNLKQVQSKLKQQFQQTLQKSKIQKMDKQNFLHKIQSSQRPQQILDCFCQWIQQRLKVSGVYIGELQNQIKKVNTLEQDGQQSHLELDKEKIIKFKFASESQKRIVVGKVLSQESVVGKILNEVQTQATNAQEENGQNQQENKQSKNKGQAYIPSVVGNQQLKFFRFPKLGAYFALTLTIKCYLKQKLFDQNTIKVQNYRKVLHDFEKQMQQKEVKFKQMYDQKVNAGTQQKQLQELEAQFERQKSQIQKPKAQQFGFYQRKFVVCIDTLGLDRQISQIQKQELRQYISHLKKSWQNCQKKQLQHDIQHQLSLLKPHHEQGQDTQIPNYPQQFTTLLQQEQKQIPAHQQVEKVKDNQKLVELQSNTIRIQKTKQHLADEKYLALWEHLLEFNVIKYHQIIKQFLILLGFKKDQFCLKSTNVLDWIKTKALINNNRTTIAELLIALNVRGSKPQIVQPYAKCARIQKNLQGLQTSTVAAYNVYLSFILRLLNLYTKSRVQDRQARLTKIQQQRQNRELKIKQAQQKALQKKQKLDALIAQLQQKGQLQTFDQQTWKVQYDEQNPLVQIPEEIPTDIDRDIEDATIGEIQNEQKKVIQ